MKCFEQTCGHLRVLEPDEIIFDGMEADNIDAAVPYLTFVNDSSVQGKVIDNDDTNTLVLQTEGVIILLFGEKYNLYTIRCHIYESFCYLRLSANPNFRT